MLKEALEYMAEVGKKTAPSIVRTEAEPGHIYFTRIGDVLERKVAERAPAAHKAYNLDSIITLATDHVDTATLWVDPTAVVLVFGEEKRESATLVLVPSDPFAMLKSLKTESYKFTQQSLVSALRTTFRDCLQQCGSLAESIKRVKFVSGTTIEASSGHGKASIGKEVMGEVTGHGVIPDYVTFTLPVFANPTLQSLVTTVTCALDPSPADGSFKLTPLPGQIENAVEFGIQGVRNILSDHAPSSVSIYFGKP